MLQLGEVPIILAPMAGGPSTPALTAAVINAGGFGFIAAGYLSVDGLRQVTATTRSPGDAEKCPAMGRDCNPRRTAWVWRSVTLTGTTITSTPPPTGPPCLPEVHHLTRPIRAAATRMGDASVPNLWAGTGWAHVTNEPAGAIVRRIAAEAAKVA